MLLTHRFEEALTLAARLHANQVRKGTDIPYISHLLAVAALVLENGGDETAAISALLHDAVEDQGGAQTLHLIRERFGDEVAAIVDGMSDTDQTPKPPWQERKEAYIAHVESAPRRERLVSAADKLHNLTAILRDYRTIGEKLWDRFNGGREGTLWYYRALLDAYKRAGDTPLVEEIERLVNELDGEVEKKRSE